MAPTPIKQINPTMDEENNTAAAADAVPDSVEQPAAAAVQENADNATATENAAPGSSDAPAPDDTKDTASSGRPKRVRKSTTNYVPEEETKKETIIPEGKGEKLQDMPNVVAKFGDVTWSTPSLKSLYYIVFGVGKRADFKKNLLQFNGFNFTEDEEEAELEKVTQKVSCFLSVSFLQGDISPCHFLRKKTHLVACLFIRYRCTNSNWIN